MTDLRENVIEVLKTIVDPELYVDIWTLGLIYDLDFVDDGLKVKMTFTSPACPAGPYLLEEIKNKTESVEGIKSTEIEVVFQPQWQPSEELKMMLGIG